MSANPNITFNVEYLTKHKPKHRHRFYEIIYMLAGELDYFVHDRTYKLRPGNIIFINVNHMHQNVGFDHSKYKAIMIQFSKDFVQTHIDRSENAHFFYSFYYKSHALAVDEEENAKLHELCTEMLEEFNEKEAEYLYYCHTLLIQLLIFSTRIIRKDQRKLEIDYPNYLHKKISSIAGYINSHYKEKIVLQTVAKKFGISEYYLSRNFKLVTGLSFIEYLNNTRVNIARKLLEESSLNITRIAEESGFNSITHFGRVFKKIVGRSPKEYRLSAHI